MHPLLRHNDAGEVVVRWPRLAKALAIYVGVSLVTVAAVRHFAFGSFRLVHFLVFIILSLIPSLVLLYVAKRHAEGRSARQFSLSALFATITVASLLLAMLTWQHRANVAAHAERQRMEEAIMALMGNGTARVGNTTLIQVKRASFDDADLSQIVKLAAKLEEAGAPLTMLDLSGTSVTDRGVSELKTITTLEYCFFFRTSITDASIAAIGQLPRLKMLSVTETRVTPQAVTTLHRARPQLNIEPKTYLQSSKAEARELPKANEDGSKTGHL